ncbi:hypothetical protein HK102_009939 [Quaeritorhiza haematococci]|nr:hypothetical protein HK102_009939 [Quaeritorhiza haematococci]
MKNIHLPIAALLAGAASLAFSLPQQTPSDPNAETTPANPLSTPFKFPEKMVGPFVQSFLTFGSGIRYAVDATIYYDRTAGVNGGKKRVDIPANPGNSFYCTHNGAEGDFAQECTLLDVDDIKYLILPSEKRCCQCCSQKKTPLICTWTNDFLAKFQFAGASNTNEDPLGYPIGVGEPPLPNIPSNTPTNIFAITPATDDLGPFLGGSVSLTAQDNKPVRMLESIMFIKEFSYPDMKFGSDADSDLEGGSVFDFPEWCSAEMRESECETECALFKIGGSQ